MPASLPGDRASFALCMGHIHLLPQTQGWGSGRPGSGVVEPVTDVSGKSCGRFSEARHQDGSAFDSLWEAFPMVASAWCVTRSHLPWTQSGWGHSDGRPSLAGTTVGAEAGSGGLGGTAAPTETVFLKLSPSVCLSCPASISLRACSRVSHRSPFWGQRATGRLLASATVPWETVFPKTLHTPPSLAQTDGSGADRKAGVP